MRCCATEPSLVCLSPDRKLCVSTPGLGGQLKAPDSATRKSCLINPAVLSLTELMVMPPPAGLPSERGFPFFQAHWNLTVPGRSRSIRWRDNASNGRLLARHQRPQQTRSFRGGLKGQRETPAGSASAPFRLRTTTRSAVEPLCFPKFSTGSHTASQSSDLVTFHPAPFCSTFLGHRLWAGCKVRYSRFDSCETTNCARTRRIRLRAMLERKCTTGSAISPISVHSRHFQDRR